MSPEEHQKEGIFCTAVVTISFSGRSLCSELKLSNGFESCGEEICVK
jgi:hypothetical protein